MSTTKKIISIILFSIIVAIIYMFYRLYLMADEDKYGDLIYFKDIVENGDLILKSKNQAYDDTATKFDEVGVIENSFRTVYVLDSENNIKKTLFDWAERGNAQKVKVLRAKKKIDFKKLYKIDGNYNYLLSSKEYDLVTETN